MDISLGIDIGSVSVKTVLMSEDNSILEKRYVRSNGAPLQTVISVLDSLKISQAKRIAVTGTGGRLAAELLEGKFVNEVIALSNGVITLYPHIKTAVEMGGEDSKLFLFDKTSNGKGAVLKDFAMNTMCAAGTGSFLDQQANRLGISIENEFGELALKSKHPPRIAGRCSVFAKSDMIHLQQIGTPVYDVIAGLCLAVAGSFKSNVCCGKILDTPIVFLGGVAANPGMKAALERVFKLCRNSLIIPEHHAHLEAIGAVLEIREKCHDGYRKNIATSSIRDYIEVNHIEKSRFKKLSLKKDKNNDMCVFSRKENADKIDAYLGIDIGSLSTNLAVIDKNRNVITRRYLRTAGRPIEAVKRGLREIYGEIGKDIEIKGIGTTGSGRYMIGDLVGADVVKNEITAQARAAIHFDRDVDTVFEIGGQDSKYISLKDGTVIDFEMNKVCAAGTGSFIEEQAERINIDIANEFSDLAFASCNPGCYGDRCTVFIESDAIAAQQRGAKKEDIAAGISYSIVCNYLNKVVGNRKIGNRIFFQGGVAWNKAVVAAFEDITGKEIIVPPFHDVTGAIGAALLSLEFTSESREYKTRFKGFDLSGRSYTVETFECKACDNLCDISKINIEGESPRFYGTRCERFEKGRKKINNDIPDLFDERDKLLTYKYIEKGIDKNSQRIGIPKTLHFYELLPYWNVFFTSLGFDVVISDSTSREIIRHSIEYTKAELCFPAKIVHGHIMDLLNRGVDYIFLPSIINMEREPYRFEENYNCPITQAIPYIIKTAIDIEEKGAKVLELPICFQDGEKMVNKTLIRFGRRFGKSRSEIIDAIDAAVAAQKEFYNSIRNRGKEIIDSLDKFERAAVLVSRSYNGCDPGVNLDLPKKLKGIGVLAIPMDFLPLEDIDLSGIYPNMYWRSGQKMLNASVFIKDQPMLDAVFISNFNCGPDSFISYFIAEQLKDKPYLQLEIDEHSADAGVITRCEAFFDSVHDTESPVTGEKDKKITKKRVCSTILYNNHTVYLPYMCDHSYVIASAFKAFGVNSVVLPPADKETLDLGRKYTSGRECLPFIVTLGDFLKKIKETDFDPESTVFFMPQTSGPCRFGQYNRLHQVIFSDLGYGNVAVLSPSSEDSYTDFGIQLDRQYRRILWKGIVATEFLQKLTRHFRPYEKNTGQTDNLYNECLSMILHEIESGNIKMSGLADTIKTKFKKIPVDRGMKKPIIGIVGEIFIRANSFSNDNIIDKIERAGGEVWIAPMTEWILYTTHCYKNGCKKMKNYKGYASSLMQEKIQYNDEHCFEKVLSDILNSSREPDIKTVLNNSSPYMDATFEGEAILSVGKAVDYVNKGVSGIVNVMPFTCMPGLIVTAASNKLRDDHNGIPWLNMVYDGQEDANSITRIEAFVHQARQYMTNSWI